MDTMRMIVKYVTILFGLKIYLTNKNEAIEKKRNATVTFSRGEPSGARRCPALMPGSGFSEF